jgi:hypothetical protein
MQQRLTIIENEKLGKVGKEHDCATPLLPAGFSGTLPFFIRYLWTMC